MGNDQKFVTAKSGWQTRVFERTTAYLLDYPENVEYIKDAWLGTLDRVENHGDDAEDALIYLIQLQIELRDRRQTDVAAPLVNDIERIVGYFQAHFGAAYRARGASRLPVLALYAIYRQLVREMARFRDCELADLLPHSSADASSGAIGDIEVARPSDGAKFEAVEVKSDLPITAETVRTAFNKLRLHQVDRYYILTTSPQDGKNDQAVRDEVNRIATQHGCQVIVNGVIVGVPSSV